jgi:ribosomal protein S13
MSSNTPIYSIAKELNIDSNRIILACKSIGINAKGATKRLNEEELEKVKNYFETGKNVSEEIVEITQKNTSIKSKTHKIKRETKKSYFPNRLIAKS